MRRRSVRWYGGYLLCALLLMLPSFPPVATAASTAAPYVQALAAKGSVPVGEEIPDVGVEAESNETALGKDLSGGSTSSGEGQWAQLPLYGGSVYCLAITPSNPQILYAGTNGSGAFESTKSGVFKSNDGGVSWTFSSSGLTSSNVHSLAIDPENPQILYTATAGGVFKTIDGGMNWTASSSGLTNTYVFFLAIDPGNSQTLYAGSNGSGVYKSENGGANWTASSTGLANTFVRSLAIDPGDTQILFAGTGGGIYKSSDGGERWDFKGLVSSDVWSLAIDPGDSQILYAGAGGGVFKSIDGGMNWTASSTGLTSSHVWSLGITPSNSQILYASTWGGVFKSIDGGASWNTVSNGLPNNGVCSLINDPGNSQTLYVGTWDGGVFKSSDGGVSWFISSIGLTNRYIQCIALDPNNAQTLYTGTYGGGVFKNIDGGTSGAAFSIGLTNGRVYALAVDPHNSQVLYAGTYGSGIFKSSEAGTNWTVSSTGLTNSDVQCLTIDPNNSRIIYSGTSGGGVYKSTNGGTSWTSSSSGLTNSNEWSLAIDPSNSQTLYASAIGGGVGVFKSIDGGANWTASFSSPPSDLVYPLAIDPSNSQILYVGTYLGSVFKSGDGGANWTASSTGLANNSVWSLAIDPHSSKVLYAGTRGGVFKSSNGGKSWITFSSGLTNSDVNCLAIDPNNPQILYAGSNDGGVWKYTPSSFFTLLSPNGGESWPISSTQTITWTSTNLEGNVALLLSLDGGSTWTSTIGTATATTGVFAWKVSGPASASCRLRIVSLQDPSILDQSDGSFSITASSMAWLQLFSASPTSPSIRRAHSLVYDESSGQVILSGGIFKSDTWSFNPLSPAWTQLFPSSSPPADHWNAAMAYDPDLRCLIRFGGPYGPNDTWRFNYTPTPAWTNLLTGNPPPVLEGPAMAYDPKVKKMILFGGRVESPTVSWVSQNDTWSFDTQTNTWEMLSPTGSIPAPRHCHGMIYDPVLQKIVLFGGERTDPPSQWNDLWTYDSITNQWEELHPIGMLPAPRNGFAMDYDQAHQCLVVFGGDDRTQLHNDTWIYSSLTNRWTKLPLATSPSPRSSAMAFSPESQSSLLFDGREVGDTWTLDLGGPIVNTGSATAVAHATANLAGSILTRGFDCQAWFEWGLSDQYGTRTDTQNILSNNDAVQLSVALSSLLPETTYHFRLVASNEEGLCYSADRTFTTTKEPPSIRLLSPNGGENWLISTTQTITWTSSRLAGNIHLLLLKDGGSTFTATIAENIPNTGAYSWNNIQPISPTLRVRVVSASSPGVFDDSDGNFWIDVSRFDRSAANLAYNKPVESNYPGSGIHSCNTVVNGSSLFPYDGEWYVDPWSPPLWLRIDLGATYQIDTIDTLHAAYSTWNRYSRPKELRIEFDDGQSVVVTRETVTGYGWCRNTFPLHSTRYVKIIILSTETSGEEVYPTCTGFDEINIYGAPSSLVLLSPNGGENWPIGSSQAITWTSTDLTGGVCIELTRDGTTWQTLSPSTTNTGSYVWTTTSPSSTTCRVRVSSVDSPFLADSSDADFSIYDAGPWPMFRHNSQHAGQSPYNGPSEPAKKWEFATGGGVYSSPAIGCDGTVYVGSNDNNLYAINPDGSKKWEFVTGSLVQSSPAIGSDGTVYVGSGDGKLYALNLDGSKKWEFATGGAVDSSPAIGSDGTVYVGSWDGKLYALNLDGSKKWEFATGSGVFSSPAIGSDGTVYVGSGDGKLYALNLDGSKKWEFVTGSWVQSSPAIGSDGTVYVGSLDNKLYALNPDGSKKWEFATGNMVDSSPALGSDGTVYVGSYDNKLYAIDPEGSKKWEFATGSGMFSSPAIGSDGTVYVGSWDNKLLAIGESPPPSLDLLSPNGGESWPISSTQTITWTATTVIGDVAVVLSRDGGNTWTETIASSVSAATGSCTWMVTAPASTNCRVRVVSVSNPAISDQSDADFSIIPPGSLTISFSLQGATTSYTATFAVSFYQPGGASPLFSRTVTVPALAGSFTLTGVTAGSYDIKIKEGRALSALRTGVVIGTGTTTVDFGEQRVGDANGDDVVSILDFALLKASFGKSTGQAGYDPRADFNGDGTVNAVDFVLMKSNFGRWGP